MTQSPLLPVALAFAAGVGSAPRLHLRASEQIFWITLCVALAAALAYWQRRWPATILAWLGFFLCGSFLAAAERMEPGPQHIESLARRGAIDVARPLTLEGWARTPSQPRPGSFVFDFEVETAQQDGHTYPSSGTIRVYYYPHPGNAEPLRMAYGARWTLALRNLRAPRSYGNPGAYDYAGAMRRQQISFTALLRDPESDLESLPGERGSRWRGAVFRAREKLLAAIDTLFSGQAERQAILKAMLLGDDNWLSPRSEDAFQNSGTYHVLVISGWNVAVFAIPLLLALSRPRVPVWVSSLIVFLAVASFALLAQSEIPVIRASLMFLCYLLARIIYRQRVLLNSIAGAALLLLIAHPADFWDWGFQLSFLAVLTLAGIALPAVEWTIGPYRAAARRLDQREADAALTPRQIQFRMDLRTLADFLVAPPQRASKPASDPAIDPDIDFSRRLRRYARAGVRGSFLFALRLSEALLFTAIMQTGYALVTAQYFHRLTWSGIVGNLLILPAASGIVLIGMALLPLSLVWLGLARLLAPLLGWAVSALTAITEMASSLSLLNGRVATPPLWYSVLFVAAALGWAVMLARRSRWAAAPAAALMALCAWLTLAPASTGCAAQRSAAGQSKTLEVTVLDVGQGDALLVCFPQGRALLVDAGGAIPIPGSPARRQDIGETVVSAYLWSRGITRLDYVLLSHDHVDHLGGLEAVFENFSVGEFWIGPDAQDRNMDWLRRRAESAGARIVRPAEGFARRVDGVEIEALSPPADWAPRRVSNNDSIVLRLRYGRRSILLAGDIEARMERRLAEQPAPLESDVLKIAHHGSKSSSTEEFLSRVHPGFGIISVGAYRRFGHPSPQVLAALDAAGITTYSTARDGAITLRTDGQRLEIQTHRDGLRPWPRFW